MLPMSHHDTDTRFCEHIRDFEPALGQTMVRKVSQSLFTLSMMFATEYPPARLLRQLQVTVNGNAPGLRNTD